MNSFFSQIYCDLVSHLTSAVPEIKWIEQDFGQDQTEIRPNLSYPAILIDFQRTEYSDMGAGAQLAMAVISFRLIVSTFSQSYSAAPISVRDKSLEYFELERKVVEALHNFMPNDGYCTPLVRVSDSTENRGDIGLRIRTIFFSTSFEDEA